VGLRILGPLELVADRTSFKIGGPREHIVLAALALRANRVTSVAQLMDAVWGDLPPSTARGQIQGCISGLRKLFGGAGLPEAIKTQSSGYLLSLAHDDLDSEQFHKLVAVAHRQAADQHAADAAATLRCALDLWRGPALDGLQSDMVRRGAALLEDARLDAIEERVRLDLELGGHEEIIGEMRALLAEHPLRERLYGFLMLALYRSGRQAEALEVCRGARATLVAELGLEPGQELRDLERAVLNRDASLDLPPAATVLGSPAAKHAASPRQLPSSIADFIGRKDHIREISQLLSDKRRSEMARYAVPIVALSGRGGVGKSTLALRVAHELGDAYPDGHLYAHLQDPNGEDSTMTRLARFLRSLGVSVIPEDLAERAEMYRSRLATKRLLLVLDDVTSEQQVLPLLPGSPSCAVIVTSRTRLYLSGAYWVDVDAFDNETSMDLLATIVGRERLEAEQDSAEELVRYCGGLPLALRIAGARLASRPHWRISELSRRLKNEMRRLDELSHHGLELRSSIGLTYRSLPELTQRLFRLLALISAPDFPGWTAAALLDIDVVDAEELLEQLVDAQMLDTVRGQNRRLRYRFHDLIRVYARERLMETETDAERNEVLARILGAWLALAEEAHRKEYGGDYTILHGTAPRRPVTEWGAEELSENPMEWLESERAALVAAVRQAAVAGMDEMCWDLALTSVSLFEVKGYLDDWRETAELAHRVSVQAGNRTGSAAMLYSLGTLHMVQKRLGEAERLFASALELFEADGNIHGAGLVLRNAAFVDRLQGNVETMLARYEAALSKLRAVGDVIGEANILRSLAKFRIDEGDLDEARHLLSEALALCQRVNYLRGEAQVASRFAELHLRAGQILLARQTLHTVLRTVREIGDRIGEAHALYGLGIVRRREGRLDSAEATLVHALTIAERVGDRLIEGQAHYALGELGVARADILTATEHLTKAKTVFGELGSSLWLAKTLILLSELHGGNVALVGQDIEKANSLLAHIDSKEAARLLRQLAEMRSALPLDGEFGSAQTVE
jgi:DNA-binding SARP family transcriptional activator/tetratricopeptide (TPR) repeat protein